MQYGWSSTEYHFTNLKIMEYLWSSIEYHFFLFCKINYNLRQSFFLFFNLQCICRQQNEIDFIYDYHLLSKWSL
jgi:hypothetical protein